MLIKSILASILAFILGTSFAKIKPKILDGDYTSIEMYPYSAFIITKYSDSERRYESTCGASILNQNILLTAAHCVNFSSITKIKTYAIVGYTNVTNRNTQTVSTIKKHEKYSKYLDGIGINDIALLKLKKSLKFGKTVKRVAIMKYPPCYGPASVAGWGRTSLEGGASKVLIHVRGLEVWSRDECLDWYRVAPETRHLLPPKGLICVGQTFNPKGIAIKGDSGSALILRDYIQIGIVSQSIHLNTKGDDPVEDHYFLTLQVYTDVRYYYDWILKNVKKLSC